MKPVCNWLQGKLETSRDMSPLMIMWQASSLTQNTIPRQHIQTFQ